VECENQKYIPLASGGIIRTKNYTKNMEVKTTHFWVVRYE